jgi:hypothetical protein
MVKVSKGIPRPSVLEVKKYLALWNRDVSFMPLEKALETLFTKTWARNDDMDGVIPKVCTLDKIYATRIYRPFYTAKRIIALKIDKQIEEGNLELVNELAKAAGNDGKEGKRNGGT